MTHAIQVRFVGLAPVPTGSVRSRDPRCAREGRAQVEGADVVAVAHDEVATATEEIAAGVPSATWPVDDQSPERTRSVGR
ncbi:hypothetical protein GCM10009629_21180 [Pseudonocardia alni]